jgi:hypothetical protein
VENTRKQYFVSYITTDVNFLTYNANVEFNLPTNTSCAEPEFRVFGICRSLLRNNKSYEDNVACITKSTSFLDQFNTTKKNILEIRLHASKYIYPEVNISYELNRIMNLRTFFCCY